MTYYDELKNELVKNKEELDYAYKESEIIASNAAEVENVLDKLKLVQFNKNYKQISNDDIEKNNQFAKDIKKIIKGFKLINNLKKIIKEIEETYQNLKRKNREVYWTVQLQ